MTNTNAQWYYARNGQQEGPFPEATLRGMFASGQLNAADLVWCEGMGAWTAIGQIPAFSGPGGSGGAVATPQTPNARQPYSQPTQSAQQPYVQPQTYTAAASTAGANYNPNRGPTQQGMAVAGLVMAVIPVFPMPLLGFIFSMIALNGMKKHNNDEGKGLATAGAIVGGILAALMCVGITIWIVFFSLLVGAAAAGAH